MMGLFDTGCVTSCFHGIKFIKRAHPLLKEDSFLVQLTRHSGGRKNSNKKQAVGQLYASSKNLFLLSFLGKKKKKKDQMLARTQDSPGVWQGCGGEPRRVDGQIL